MVTMPIAPNPGPDPGPPRQDTGFSLVPKDWVNAPIFSPVKQTKPREVSLSNGTIWKLGIPDPFSGKPSSHIDMTHTRVLLAILSFWVGQNPLTFSLRELARRS